MSNKNLVVKVSKRKVEGKEAWEGVASLPGVLPTKIAKSKGTETKFGTRNALTAAAEKLAERYGFAEVKFEGAEQAPAQKKPAPAKRKAVAPTTTAVTSLS